MAPGIGPWLMPPMSTPPLMLGIGAGLASALSHPFIVSISGFCTSLILIARGRDLAAGGLGIGQRRHLDGLPVVLDHHLGERHVRVLNTAPALAAQQQEQGGEGPSPVLTGSRRSKRKEAPSPPRSSACP
jgi:hypothetical protein